MGNFTPTVWQKDPVFTSCDDWSRTAGGVVATGNEQVVTLGHYTTFSPFESSTGCEYQSIYLLDDVGIYAFPSATASLTSSGCQAQLTPSGVLPASSQAQYVWTTAGGAVLPSPDGLTALVPATQAGTYTLTITVPSPDPAQPAFAPVSSTITVQPPVVTAATGGPYVMYSSGGGALAGTGTPTGGTGAWSVQAPGGQFPLTTGGTAPFVNAALGTLPANIAPGTYLVCYTYTSPQGCVSEEECTTLSILPYSCELDRLRPDYTLKPPVGASTLTLTLNGQQVSTVFPAGVYHVTCPVLLTQGHFTVKPGAVFLFDPGTSLVIDGGTSLTAHATRFTAACDQMWNGIILLPQSEGLYLGDPAATLQSALPAVKPYGTGAQYGEVSHAVTGVRWESPDQTPLRLVSIRILHNITSVQAATYPQNVNPTVHKYAAIVNCEFDGNSLLFKRDPSGQLLGDWLPLAHLDLTGWSYYNQGGGVEMPVYGNRFANALLGIVSSENVDPFSLRLGEGNLLENNRVMGVAVPTLTYALSLGDIATPTQFVLPSPTTQVSTRLRAELKSRYSWLTSPYYNLNPAQAWGAWVGWQGSSPAPGDRIVDVTGAEFTAAPGTPRFGSALNPRTGLEVQYATQRYHIENCRFTRLRTGLRLGLQTVGEECIVADNVFHDTGVGIAVRNAWPTLQGFPSPVFWPVCNTFLRTNNVTGQSTGILIEQPDYAGAPVVIFDDYIDNVVLQRPHRQAMKNRFMGVVSPPSTFRYLDNQSGQLIKYTGYQLGVSGAANFNTLVEISARSGGSFNFTALMVGTIPLEYDPDNHSCNLEMYSNGFQRAGRPDEASDTSTETIEDQRLSQNFPNPFTDETTIRYAAGKANNVELLVRELISGNIVRRVSLNPTATTAHLAVAGLLAGLYTYSVVADDVVIGTRKLVVGR